MEDELDIQEKTPGGRDRMAARLQAKYPDRNFATDDEMWDQVNGDYDDYEGRMSEMEERERSLVEMMNNDPRSAQFIADLAHGKDPWIALIKRIGIDGITDLLNDPGKMDAYGKANAEYLERVAKEKNLEEDYETNITASLGAIDGMLSSGVATADEIDAAVDLLHAIGTEALQGKYSRENIEMALKALRHDADVTAAAMEGEVRGRNRRVEEHLRSQRGRGGDGLPQLGGANNSPSVSEGESIFDLASKA